MTRLLWLALACLSVVGSSGPGRALAAEGAPQPPPPPDPLEGWPTWKADPPSWVTECTGSVGESAKQLAPLFNYSFVTPRAHLQRGLSHLGPAPRLRRAVSRMMRGENVSVGVIGGSITWGVGVTLRGERDWFSIFARWLRSAFPRTPLHILNSGVPGTPSGFMLMCLDNFIDQRVELMFMEYILNDGFIDSIVHNPRLMVFERLVRRVLDRPSAPGIAMMQVPSHGMLHGTRRQEWRPFHSTPEDLYSVVGQYYDGATMSLRNAVYHWGMHLHPGAHNFSAFMIHDLIHPNDLGHKVMADLAVYLVQRLALGLVEAPFSPEEEAEAVEKVQMPMYPRNQHTHRKTCLTGQDLLSVVGAHVGWDWINEGADDKPKWGFVSTTPGTFIEVHVKIPARIDSQLMVGYLKSYEHMGTFHVRCASGCTCAPATIDGHHERLESTTYLHNLLTSPANSTLGGEGEGEGKAKRRRQVTCTLRLEVLPESRSPGGEHKVKLAGVMVSEVQHGEANMDHQYFPLVDLMHGHFGEEAPK